MSKKLKQYKRGGWFNQVKDAGKLVVDNSLSTIGMGNLIDDSNYTNKWAKKAAPISDEIGEWGSRVVMTAFNPALGAAVTGVQEGMKAAIGDSDADIQRQKMQAADPNNPFGAAANQMYANVENDNEDIETARRAVEITGQVANSIVGGASGGGGGYGDMFQGGEGMGQMFQGGGDGSFMDSLQGMFSGEGAGNFMQTSQGQNGESGFDMNKMMGFFQKAGNMMNGNNQNQGNQNQGMNFNPEMMQGAMDIISNFFADGGSLNGGVDTNAQLQQYQGAKHEQGGIPVDQNGQPVPRKLASAEVEGGETKLDDYVFSERNKVPGTKKTFAKASKEIESKYKSRIESGDKIAKQSRRDELTRLMNEQEAYNMKKEAKEKSFKMSNGGRVPSAPRRNGVRVNEDGSESTHLYTSGHGENDKGETVYYAHPTLFQNADGSWVDYSDDPKKAKEEAIKRGEMINFETQKESQDFAKGSWKEAYNRDGMWNNQYMHGGKLKTLNDGGGLDPMTAALNALYMESINAPQPTMNPDVFDPNYMFNNPNTGLVNNVPGSVMNWDTTYVEPKKTDPKYVAPDLSGLTRTNRADNRYAETEKAAREKAFRESSNIIPSNEKNLREEALNALRSKSVNNDTELDFSEDEEGFLNDGEFVEETFSDLSPRQKREMKRLNDQAVAEARLINAQKAIGERELLNEDKGELFNEKVNPTAYLATLPSDLKQLLMKWDDPNKYGRLSPNLVNYNAARDEARKQNAVARAIAAKNARNLAGSGLASAAAGDAILNSNLGSQLGNLYMQEYNTNQQMRNQYDQLNNQLAIQEDIANRQDRARMQETRVQALENIGRNLGTHKRDQALTEADNKTNRNYYDFMNSISQYGNVLVDKDGRIVLGHTSDQK